VLKNFNLFNRNIPINIKMETKSRMHVSLMVSDINKTIEFYNQFFATEPSKIKQGYAKYELTEPGLIISFIESAIPPSPRFGHLGFQVNSLKDLEKRKIQAKDNNLISSEEENIACCYAVQNKFWVKDPDQYEWEVYYFIKDIDVNSPKYESCCEQSEIANKAAEVEPACC
jgi:catechol 2,3-dioxygenase-like lactoylglutathione lyase family enzyme